MANYMIVGGSRGLGLALARSLPDSGDGLWIISRTPPPALLIDSTNCEWIQCDLATPIAAIETVARALGDREVSVLVYCAGIWETTSFLEEQPEFLERIITVNLLTPILLCQHLLRGKQIASGGKIIFIASTSGLDNEGSQSVAYASSKAGLRTAAFSIREIVRSREIGVTCISPGSIARGDANTALQSPDRIAVSDLTNIVRTIIQNSVTSCVKEIVLPAMRDTDV